MANPGCIHLRKCWSYICTGKIIKKYWNTHFVHQIIFFFSSADRKEKKVLRPRYSVAIL